MVWLCLPQDHSWNQDRSNIRETTTNTAGDLEPVQSLCKVDIHFHQLSHMELSLSGQL